MTAHPDIAKISFTGSTETGKHVIRSAAGTVKRLTLEMGGNDAAIVLPDADWQSIIPQLFWGAVGNSGQWCVGIKRLYVHRSFHEGFVSAFVEYASQQKLGDGRPGAEQDAVRQGARLPRRHQGGRSEDRVGRRDR
jgi:acyl-CoA reductase-like NAD-dependent aldehyde dehydrogenase